MVINYFGNKENHTVPPLTVTEIIKIINSSPELATDLENVENINEPLKTTSNPIIKFYPDVNYKWDEIEDELREKRPIIAWIRETPDPYEWAHVIVIKEYRPSDRRLIYLDSLKEGEQNMYVGDFLALWENVHNAAIFVKEGEVIQLIFDEIMEDVKENDP